MYKLVFDKIVNRNDVLVYELVLIFFYIVVLNGLVWINRFFK